MRQNRGGTRASPFGCRVHDAPREKPVLHAGPTSGAGNPRHYLSLRAPESLIERWPLVTTPEGGQTGGAAERVEPRRLGNAHRGALGVVSRACAGMARPERAELPIIP